MSPPLAPVRLGLGRFRGTRLEPVSSKTGFIETFSNRFWAKANRLQEKGTPVAESEDSTTAYSIRSGDTVVLNTGGARGDTSAQNVGNRRRGYQKWIRSVRFTPRGFEKKELGRFDAFGAFRQK